MFMTMATCKNNLSVFVITFAIRWAIVLASDPGPLQDFCVADLQSGIKVNGYPCKDPATVVPEDFYSSMLGTPGVLNATNHVAVNAATVQKMAGLNSLGLALGRIDYAVGGVNGFHTHPRASEMIYVLDGEIEVGFITTANVLISKVLKKGEIFVFPRGLIHFQRNVGAVTATIIAAFDSQLPGTQAIGPALFATSPAISPDILAKSLKMEVPAVEEVKAKFAPKKK